MSMFEASAEPWDPAVPDELRDYPDNPCENCDMPLGDDQECSICGWTKDDPA